MFQRKMSGSKGDWGLSRLFFHSFCPLTKWNHDLSTPHIVVIPLWRMNTWNLMFPPKLVGGKRTGVDTHIPPGEKENHRLKSALGKGYVIVPWRVAVSTFRVSYPMTLPKNVHMCFATQRGDKTHLEMKWNEHIWTHWKTSKVVYIEKFQSQQTFLHRVYKTLTIWHR